MTLETVACLPVMGKPIVEMFWVAEYNNGQALPQYDTFSGRENKYEWIDHKNVIRFWWIPITPKMAQQFPNTRFNPRLRRYAVELNGSKGFVARRCNLRIGTGGMRHWIKCYVLGIEGGPRREIYPDGTVKNIAVPRRGETQDLLHHG